MELIIEEISKGHKLIGRQKYSGSTINIGRGYDNDLIMSDPHVCAHHLSIEFTGEHWVITTKDTVNGSFIGDSKVSANQHIVHSGDIISIGKSQIRLLFPNHPVETSVSFSPFEQLIDIARHPAILTLSVILFALVTSWLFYLNNPKEVTFTQLLVPAIGMTLLFSIWPFAVAITSHLTKNDARTLSQLGICFLFFNLMWFSDVFERFMQFNLASGSPLLWLIAIIPLALSFALFWFNCSIGFHMTEKRRVTVAAALTILLFGGSFLVQLSKKPDFNPRPKYNATIMTPGYLISPSNTVENFVADTNKLFEKAKKAATKK